MIELLPSIRHNLARLARFEGRDSRRQFWPWAIFVFIVAYAAQIIAMLPWMADMFYRSIALSQTIGAQKIPDQAAANAQTETMIRETMSELGDLWLPMAAIELVTIVLLAAAVSRRLHDRGRRGWWGLLPVPFAAIALFNAPRAGDLMMGVAPRGLDALMLALGYAFWIAFLILIVMLVRDGDQGPNRFGPEPQRSA